MYSTCLYLWYSNIYAIGQGGSGHFSNPQGSAGRPIVYPIHHLMTALLLVKTLSIFFESIRYHYLRVVGHAEFWSFVYYFFTFLRGSLLFLTILLLGTGGLLLAYYCFLLLFLFNPHSLILYPLLPLIVSLRVEFSETVSLVTREEDVGRCAAFTGGEQFSDRE